ncbi:hypothetical protein AX16_005119 [Volvariella volvacea WC 439]|nr:hypothetical protein AX16_005119 [Volvariella volvacea WC 439]
MAQRRSSYHEPATEQERILNMAQALQSSLQKTNLNLLAASKEFYETKLDLDEGTEEVTPKDPAIVAGDVAAQISFLRKLKFQYLEQNAKDKYVKSIVSDIDDAPIVSAEDNKVLQASNEAKKQKLKASKQRLEEVQGKIRALAPQVRAEYQKVQNGSTEAVILAQKIIDARLALSRIRQTHPHPRLTVPLADKKLADQVVEMQHLEDENQRVVKQVQEAKQRVKSATIEAEKLRSERAEIEKAVRLAHVDEDDARLAPLYEWFTSSLSLQRSLHGLQSFDAVSDNELHLTYSVGPQLQQVVITLIFAPDTSQLINAEVGGMEGLSDEIPELIDTHIQVNDPKGLISAILARARAMSSEGSR